MLAYFFRKNILVCFVLCLSSPLWAKNNTVKPKGNSFEPIMVTIPAGQFFMGEQSDESGKNEMPVHSVNVKSFKLAKTEITVGQYRQFVADSGYMGGSTCWSYDASYNFKEQPGSWMDLNNAPSESNPVVCIGWDDAKAYVKWLAQKTGKKYRLPTEAEWEYAARAGSATKYYFGNDSSNICSYANVADASGQGTYGWNDAWGAAKCKDSADFTAAVGSYTPNAFGLYDMVGNVWEWVEDCYHETYDGAPSNGSAWVAGECTSRVIHGGSWFGSATWARSAIRHGDEPAGRSTTYGFRIARDI
jgi:formylglycine-generating enzyme required for sulfatase activity